jgi:replicative DNA helicase
MTAKAAPDLRFERGLPASLDAERTILGAVLLDNAAYAEASAKLAPEDFALTAHQRVFRRMGDIITRRQQCDIVTLSETLGKHKEIESVGGVAWLASLTEGLPRRLSIIDYVAIVLDKAMLRQLIGIHSDAITRAADQSEEAESILSSARSAIEALSSQRVETGLQLAAEYLASESLTAAAMMDRTAKDRGIQSGITDLDTMTCGLQRGELVIVAARPSMGKSDFADNLAGNVALNYGKTVALFSPEMDKYSVLARIVCARGRVDRGHWKSGKLTSEDRRYFADALEELKTAPLYINDCSSPTVSRIRSESMHLKARAGLDLLIVDYLQLMSAADFGKVFNREQEVAKMSGGMKRLAKDLGVPVVLLAQISRENTKRTDKRPVLSDLRESGAIEQDADVVAFLHREEYYERENKDHKGKGEIIIAKQRNGAVGTVHAAYNAVIGRWSDTQPDEATEFQMGFNKW